MFDLAASQEDVATIQWVFLALPLQAPDEVVHSAVGFLTHHLPCGQPSVQGATSMVQLSHPSSIWVRVGDSGNIPVTSSQGPPAQAPHYPKLAPWHLHPHYTTQPPPGCSKLGVPGLRASLHVLSPVVVHTLLLREVPLLDPPAR